MLLSRERLPFGRYKRAEFEKRIHTRLSGLKKF